MEKKRDLEKIIDVDVEKNFKKFKDSKINELNELNKLNELKEEKKIEIDSKLNNLKFCKSVNFCKYKWLKSLSEKELRLLDVEIKYMDITWLAVLSKEIVKPYFLKLKEFLTEQKNTTIFPKENEIYTWSNLTSFTEIKCIIIGQDPYHNYNQAHGLAFSVLEGTKLPPSLLNIYKCIKINYPNFEYPRDSLGRLSGSLVNWAKNGILLLNTVLTVEAHKPNSHSSKGWEIFTREVIRIAIEHYSKNINGFVIMAWGSSAQKLIDEFDDILNSDVNIDNFLVLKTVHPSPLSANRGFFNLNIFKNCNEWLEKKKKNKINWTSISDFLVP